MKILSFILALMCATAALGQSTIQGVITQFAGGLVSATTNTTINTGQIDAQGNFSLQVPQNPSSHLMTFTPPQGTPFAPFSVTVTAAPGVVTNITGQIAPFVPVIGINLGIANQASVGTNAQGYAIPGTGSGGTVITCSIAGGIVYRNGSGNYVCTAAGTSGQVLTWPASGTAPIFQTPSGGLASLADNTLLNSPSTGKLFINTDSIGLIANGGFPEELATLLTIPSGNQSINAIGSASLPDMLSCHTAGAGSCTQDGTWPLTFPLGVASNSKILLEAAYNDLSNMGSTPTNDQLSYYFGGLKSWLLEFGVPDSQKLAANGAYCTTTGTWTSVSAVPGGSGTFPTGTIKTNTPGATLVCTTRNATDAGIIGYKSTGSTTATYTVSIVNAGTTYIVSDPYTGSTTLNQTAAYTTAWGGTANLYAVGQSGMAGGYTTITLTAASNGSDPVIVVAPYFISPSSSLQNFPAVEMMLESRAGCNGTCSSVAGAQHNDTNTNIMRKAQISAVNELRSNGLNVSYFDPNATPSGFNSSDSSQTADGTHPNSTSAQFIANAAFVNLNSAATTADHFLPVAATNCALLGSTYFVSGIDGSGNATCSQIPIPTACGSTFAHHASITLASATGGSDLSDFPVLLGFNGATTNSITLTNLKTVSNGGQVQSSTGLDVIFCTASSGGSQLPHELVTGSYVPSTGAGEWYVKSPTVSSSAGSVIFAFWGESAAADTSNAPAVWANGYQAVYHGGIASSLALTDSTSNANTLTNGGATATTGEFGGAFSVTAVTGAEDIFATGIPSGSAARTLEGWANITAGITTDQVPFSIGNSNGTGSFALDYYQTSPTFYLANTSPGDIYAFSGTTISKGAWHSYVAVLPSGSGAPNTTLMYADGVAVTSSPSCLGGACTSAMNTSAGAVRINGQYASSVVAAQINGTIDEVRVSSVARTAGWVATQYANQSNPATFATVGTIH